MGRSFMALWLIFGLVIGLTGTLKGQESKDTQAEQGTSQPVKQVENYFVKNTIEPEEGKTTRSGLIKSQADFNTMFGIARVMGKQEFLPEDFFEKNALAYYIIWDNAYYEFMVDSLTYSENQCEIKFSKKGEKTPTCTYACPLMLPVKKDTTEVKFTELPGNPQ